MQRFLSRTARVCASIVAATLLVSVPATTANAADTESGPAPSVPATVAPQLTLPPATNPPTPATTPATTATTVTTTASVATAAASTGYATTPATTVPGGAPLSDYELGKQAVAQENWKTAIALFAKVTRAQPKNADAWNLYAYSIRKNGNPAASVPLYAKALKLNPKHIGALEYQGEAYVQLKQIRKAKVNLAKLKAVCGVTCEEYLELAEAING